MNYRPTYIFKIISKLFLFVVFVAASTQLLNARESQGLYLLRDAEIENYLNEMSDPLFLAANIPPKNVEIHLIGNNTPNAFVSGGLNMFIHTGLLTRATDTSQIRGVLAHEIGHMAGGHLIRRDEASSLASSAGLLPMALGLAATALGAPELGIGAIAFGQTVTQVEYLKYNRSQESAADLFAIEFLEKTENSANGLIDFFSMLYNDNIIQIRDIDPYLITHPLPNRRIAVLKDRVADSAYKDLKTSDESNKRLLMIQAKISAFLNDSNVTMRSYSYDDVSDPAYYARSVAYMLNGKLDFALEQVNHLIDKYPENPYYYELKGQSYFENSKADLAIEPYQKALKYLPGNALFMQNLARAYIVSRNKTFLPKAEKLLIDSVFLEPENIFSWELLARNYEMQNKRDLAIYATAESRFFSGNLREARRFCTIANKNLDKEAIAFKRCEDIIHISRKEMEDNPRNHRQRPRQR